MAVDAQHSLTLHSSINRDPQPGDADVDDAATMPSNVSPAGRWARLRRWVSSSNYSKYLDLLGASHEHRSCCN